MPDRPVFAARLAVATQLLFAAILAAVASLRFEPGFVPRGVILFSVFALPGVVGSIGIRARQAALLMAACVTSGIGSLIAFSGVTLIFLVPALLFLVGAVRMGPIGTQLHDGPWLGTFTRVGAAAAIVVLLVGAGGSALLLTEEGCWTEYRAGIGARIEPAPYSTGEVQVPSGASAYSCSTGLVSARGTALGAVFGISALWIAAASARRRGRYPAADAGSATVSS